MKNSKHHSHPGAKEYSDTSLRRVNWTEDHDMVHRLFREYRAWLADHAELAASTPSVAHDGLALLDRIISELPGVYGPPRGDVILAFKDEDLVACGALREWEPKVGEIKRIYVRADHRGPGFGPILTGALLDRARDLDFDRVRVDTLPTMYAAIQFYQEMGFKPIAAYWPHPAAGALFFEWKAAEHRASRSRPGRSKSKRSVK
ncbi:MAG: GNAT family N-acetyltransferase [Thermoplasmata archaeon]